MKVKEKRFYEVLLDFFAGGAILLLAALDFSSFTFDFELLSFFVFPEPRALLCSYDSGSLLPCLSL